MSLFLDHENRQIVVQCAIVGNELAGEDVEPFLDRQIAEFAEQGFDPVYTERGVAIEASLGHPVGEDLEAAVAEIELDLGKSAILEQVG